MYDVIELVPLHDSSLLLIVSCLNDDNILVMNLFHDALFIPEREVETYSIRYELLSAGMIEGSCMFQVLNNRAWVHLLENGKYMLYFITDVLIYP